jgi:hypothetical protein
MCGRALMGSLEGVLVRRMVEVSRPGRLGTGGVGMGRIWLAFQSKRVIRLRVSCRRKVFSVDD